MASTILVKGQQRTFLPSYIETDPVVSERRFFKFSI